MKMTFFTFFVFGAGRGCTALTSLLAPHLLTHRRLDVTPNNRGSVSPSEVLSELPPLRVPASQRGCGWTGILDSRSPSWHIRRLPYFTAQWLSAPPLSFISFRFLRIHSARLLRAFAVMLLCSLLPARF